MKLNLGLLFIPMRKIVFLLSIVIIVTMFGAVSIPEGFTPKQPLKRAGGCGYRIVEYGVGVDCNGDTVKLVKSMGFQRLVPVEEVAQSPE